MNVSDVRGIEGDAVQGYWDAITNIVDDKFGVKSRSNERKPKDVTDPVNALLNYGYSVAKNEEWKVVNCRVAELMSA